MHLCFPVDDSIHGSVYSDIWFGGVAWSPDERLVAYIADMPPVSVKEDHAKEDETKPVTSAWADPLGHKYDAGCRGPFGETYANKRATPALFIADMHTGHVSLAACPPGFLLGQPQWSCNNKIVCIAAYTATSDDVLPPTFPDDLGLIYCYNLPMSLVAFDAPKSWTSSSSLENSMKILTEKNHVTDFNCTSPRISDDGRDLIYISAPRNDSQNDYILTHNTTKVLRYIRISEDCQTFSSPETLIDVPENPALGAFPGLYMHGLPRRPWVSKDSIAMTTTWGFTDRIVVVKLQRHTSSPVTVCSTQIKDYVGNVDCLRGMSTYVLDCYQGNMLISVTDAANPSRLVIIRQKEGENKELEWVTELSAREKLLKSLVKKQTVVSLVAEKTDSVDSFACSAREFDATAGDKAVDAFQIFVIEPTKSANSLVVCPHGGPHVASVKGFSVSTATLLARGFTVMFVNYRGSLGLGEASLRTLPGRVGTQDVNETIQATRWALKQKDMELNAKRTVFVGGSHSGFLGAHVSLIKGLFNRTVLRNPVVDIASMVGSSDIPNWCFVEAGVEYDGSHAFVPNPKQLEQMYLKSPVSKVKKAIQDGAWPRTLLQVGGSDKRVPPAQSVEWRRLLTAAFGEGIVTMRWYERSTHAIDDVPEGDDAWVQALDFLCEVLDKHKQ